MTPDDREKPPEERRTAGPGMAGETDIIPGRFFGQALEAGNRHKQTTKPLAAHHAQAISGPLPLAGRGLLIYG